MRDLRTDVANRISVEVAELDFIGAFCRATLRADAVTLTADFSSNLMRDLGVEQGRRLDVACRWIASGSLPHEGGRMSLALPVLRCGCRATSWRCGPESWRVAAVLLLIVGAPLWALLAKGFEDQDGRFVGLANYLAYFSTPALFNSALNSFRVALVVDRDRGADRLPVQLCAHPHEDAGQGAVPGRCR